MREKSAMEPRDHRQTKTEERREGLMHVVIGTLVGVVAGVVATRLYYDKALAKLKQAEQTARSKLAAKLEDRGRGPTH